MEMHATRRRNCRDGKYYGDPVDAARKWVELGAEILHVVDLDATLGTGNNIEKVLEIKKKRAFPSISAEGCAPMNTAKNL